MKLSYPTVILSLIVRAHLASSKACSGGIHNECVAFYRGADCQDPGELGSYTPTCEGNCFQFDSFDSLAVTGSQFFGTDCHIYSDINCQNQIADTGNEVSGRKCVNAAGAQSMICYYDC
ncbi:hypothetical protein C8F04DRAFT_343066 [Mycena alexandri]|uniref:Uncharacterized protein n=1 Tax=Mycena alexandri TaxID=1745969 RepID=A0AAD6XDT4_9AGAR|nr:hypothetical protein C8F04DRAFT_343066 [Mycena alexandri]